MKTESYPMTTQQHATVLAALRYYQQQGLADDPTRRPAAIHDIATGGKARRHGLNARAIDRLCERINTPPAQTEARPGRTEGPTAQRMPGQLYAPNGQRIIATKDWIPGNALIDGATQNPDGTFDLIWNGETKICWDGQYTEEYRGRRIFLDEAGNEWPEHRLAHETAKREDAR